MKKYIFIIMLLNIFVMLPIDEKTQETLKVLKAAHIILNKDESCVDTEQNRSICDTTLLGDFSVNGHVSTNMTYIIIEGDGTCSTVLSSTGANLSVGWKSGDVFNPANVNNTLVGYNAGASLTGGPSNTFLGNNAGQTCATGANNIVIGSGSDVSTGALSGCIVLGVSGVASANNQLVLGSSSVNLTTGTSALTGAIQGPTLYAGYLTVLLNGQVVNVPYFN